MIILLEVITRAGSLAELVGGQDILFLVNVAEVEVEEDGDDGADNGGAGKDPNQMGVGNGRRRSQVDNVGETSVEEVDGGDEATHVDGRARVGDAVGGDVDEELRETTESIRYAFPPQRDGGDEALVDAARVRRAVVAARVGLVGLPAEEGVADTTEGAQEEAGGDTGDGAVVDLASAEEGVEGVVENGAEDDDAQGVEVANDIVGHTVAAEHGTEVVGGITQTIVVPELDGEEGEHGRGLHGALDIFDKGIIVVRLRTTAGGNDRGHSSVPPAFASDAEDAAVGHAATKDAEDVDEIRTARLVQDKTGLEPDEQQWQG